MAKYISRIGTTKVMHMVYLKEFNLELNGLSKDLNKLTIDCKRGKFKKTLYSKDGDKVGPENTTIQFDDTFMQVS